MAKSWGPIQCDVAGRSIAVKPVPSKPDEVWIVEGAPIPLQLHQSSNNQKSAVEKFRPGPAIGQRIIEYREMNGPFDSTEQIQG